MKKNYLIVLVYLLCIFLLVNPGQSQTTDRIFTELRRLEFYMLRVWEVVKEFNDPNATEYMRQARAELLKAKDLVYASPPRFVLARVHMTKAKQFTDLAGRLVLQKPFFNLKSQLNDLIDRAEKAVSQSNRVEAHYLLNQAKKFRRRAYEAFQENKIARGEEFYRAAFFFGRKCLDLLQSGEIDLTEQYENLKNSVEQLINQAEELVSTSDQGMAENLLGEAQTHYEDAIKKAESGQTEQAIKKLSLIKRLIYRLIDQIDRTETEDTEHLQNNLQTLQLFLESLAEHSESDRSQKMLDKSWQLYREAESHFLAGEYNDSRRKLILSQRIANRLSRFYRSSQAADTGQLQDQLEETRHLLGLQEQGVRETGDRQLLMLYDDANDLLDRADRALSRDNTLHAFQLIQAATRMSSRIQRQMKKAENSFDRDALKRKYRQIVKTLNSLENNDLVAEDHRPVLAQIRDFAEKGDQSLEQKNEMLAEEYLNTAWEQLKQFTDRWRTQ